MQCQEVRADGDHASGKQWGGTGASKGDISLPLLLPIHLSIPALPEMPEFAVSDS